MAKGAIHNNASHNKNRGKRKRSQIDDEEVQSINKIIDQQAPARGSNPLAINNSNNPILSKKFEELPISQYTKKALKDAKYTSLTAIQRGTLPHALCSRDVLGAAKTGSGKTLAFVIPLVERLYRSKWGKLDGIGALIVSPTRELALQIFEELRKVGKYHEFSAGLLIGGKDVEEEKAVVQNMNILVCTPGRLLQHMDETPGFDASGLQVLVLDEADRILDMGFSATLNAIVANLPKDRQTLLFSATQTKSVSSLARLSLKDPEYVSVHAEAATPTPVRLQQAYMECELHEKMDILWSFIKTHLKAKVIIFFSTCKQVKFAYEAFKRLRPGTPLRALHGRMAQFKRLAAFEQFNASKNGVLFATDIAARGLDFPSVDWVVQGDCPEDVASYIHRVGRTARYTSAGKSLLLLVPSEKDAMLKQLEEAKVPIKMLKHNPAKMQAVTPALQALLSKDAELKETAQRAVVSYLRSTFLQPNKAVFDVGKLPIAEYALSVGLPTAPKLRFLKKTLKQQQQQKQQETTDKQEEVDKKSNNGKAVALEKKEEEEEHDEEESSDEEENSDASSSDDESDGSEENDVDDPREEDDDDDLLVVKRRDVHGALGEEELHDFHENNNGSHLDINPDGINSSQKNKKKPKLKIKAGRTTGTRTVFDDEGEEVDPLSLLAANGGQTGDGIDTEMNEGLYAGIHDSVTERAAAARSVLAARDKEDRQKLRDLKKEKRVEKRSRRLQREREEAGHEMVATLANDDEEEDYSDVDSSSDEDERPGSRKRNHRGEESEQEDTDDDMDILLDSSDDEDDDNDTKTHKKKQKKSRTTAGREVAHMDMVLKKKQPTKRAPKGLSLAEQEALALQLLRDGDN